MNIFMGRGGAAGASNTWPASEVISINQTLTTLTQEEVGTGIFKWECQLTITIGTLFRKGQLMLTAYMYQTATDESINVCFDTRQVHNLVHP